jgi:hypothetical protein
MCFHPRLHPLIYYRGSLAENNVQWIRFKGLEGGLLGILYVFASNMVGERCTMWNVFPWHKLKNQLQERNQSTTTT